MPEITSVEDLLNNISPLRIYFHDNGNIGIGFNCEWEEEHGLGVLFSIDEGVIGVSEFDIALQ